VLHVAHSSDRGGKSGCHGLVFAIGCKTDRPAALVHTRTIPILSRPRGAHSIPPRLRQRTRMACAGLAIDMESEYRLMARFYTLLKRFEHLQHNGV
jgi:hypothetical protein